MNIKKIGASPLSGRIFSGTMNTRTNRWVNKVDVTDDCVAAAAEHLRHRGEDYCWPTTDGKFLILSAQVVDELPARFK